MVVAPLQRGQPSLFLGGPDRGITNNGDCNHCTHLFPGGPSHPLHMTATCQRRQYSWTRGFAGHSDLLGWFWVHPRQGRGAISSCTSDGHLTTNLCDWVRDEASPRISVTGSETRKGFVSRKGFTGLSGSLSGVPSCRPSTSGTPSESCTALDCDWSPLEVVSILLAMLNLLRRQTLAWQPGYALLALSMKDEKSQHLGCKERLRANLNGKNGGELLLDCSSIPT